MKLSNIAIVSLSAAAAAQPHRRQHPHPVKRQDVVVDYVTDIVTTTQAAAVVFVDQNGRVLSTSYANQPGPTGSPPAPQAPQTPQEPQQGPAQGSQQQGPTAQGPTAPSQSPAPYQTPTSPSPPPAAPSAPSGPSGGLGSAGYGLSYSPYNSDGTCKSQDQVNSDFGAFNGYGYIRSYGTDCDQVNTILTAAAAKGMKMWAGVYDISQVASETQALIDAASGNWNAIDTVIIGNEAVSSGMASVDQVVAAIGQARGMLRSAGFNGRIATVDTSAQVIDNPQLCQASDFAAANCHAFFNADITADQAGSYVKDQAQRVSAACGGKDTIITESGWPHAGETNGLAIPSPENQRLALDSLRSSFADGIVLFSAFNDAWKQNTAATFGAEQFWGIFGNAP